LKPHEGKGTDPRRNLKKNYIGQNHGKEEIDLVGQLHEAPNKDDNERLCLILEKAKAKMIAVTTQVPSKMTRKRRHWYF